MNELKCPKCGTSLLDIDVFCPNCGNKVADITKAKPTKDSDGHYVIGYFYLSGEINHGGGVDKLYLCKNFTFGSGIFTKLH